jgi:trimeric autotransporter adhesin
VAHTYGSFDTSKTLVDSNVNDVAMTVLPNAPIDAATGLPVPTIAVATAGGTSVIRDDGTVVDLTNSGYESNFVNFQDEQIVLNLYQTSSNNNWWAISYHDIPSSDITGLSSTTRFNGSTDDFPSILGPLTLNPSAISKDSLGNSSGLTNIYRYLPDYDKSMVAYTTSDYATGWMNGDIRLATLSDTDATNVTGAELVTNGTFATDTTGWTAANSSIAAVGGRLQVTANSGGVGYASQLFTTVVGKSYTASVEFISSTGANRYIYLGSNLHGVNLANLSNAQVVVGVNTITFIATGTSTSISCATYDSQVALFDNISVRLAEADRSVNNKGLQVFGTVTKNPVATGADLVAYSGFSGSNYLEQPVNTDLHFSFTATWSILGWFKTTDNGTNQCLISFGNVSTNTQERAIFVGSDGKVAFVNSGTGSQSSAVSTIGTSGTWVQVCIVGHGQNSQSVYLNGKLDHTCSLVTGTIPSTGILVLGSRSNFGGDTIPAANASMALWRISATAPSPEQIKKIYEDEKHLFQENAQATLYGSSDAVTALAYDDTTELLHVGTSEGRSDFQGLRRVNNTTNAVGAAISASNGMIVEE